MAQTIKNLPAMQETWVLCLGQEDPLEEEMLTHSSLLAWRIPWTEEPGGLQSTGSKELDTTKKDAYTLQTVLPLVPCIRMTGTPLKGRRNVGMVPSQPHPASLCVLL